jgi:starch synthase
MMNLYGRSTEETFGSVRGLRAYNYAVLRNTAPYLATPLRLLGRQLRREHCKAILCQEYEYARFDVCVALGKLLRIPVFATFQGGSWHLSRFENIIRPLTIKACNGLIIAAKEENQRVRSKYHISPFRIAAVFNPIQIEMWDKIDRNEIRAKLDIGEDAMVVVWHGRVEIHRKGLDILLEAWEMVCHALKGKNLQLLLVGTGNDADELHHRIRTMQLEGIRWLDRYLLNREAIRNYLCAANVYVLSSRHEGFPVAPIEAMSCGLPVVATDVNGISDIFDGGEAAGGIVVPSCDAIALAAALEQILTDKALGRKLGKRARRRAEACFSLEAVGRQLRNFLSIGESKDLLSAGEGTSTENIST